MDIEQAIQEHKKWVESDSKQGKKLCIEDERLNGIHIFGQNLCDSIFSNCSFCNCKFSDTDLFGSYFAGSEFDNCIFEDCNINKSDLDHVFFNNVRFIRCTFLKTSFFRSKAKNIELIGSVLPLNSRLEIIN